MPAQSPFHLCGLIEIVFHSSISLFVYAGDVFLKENAEASSA